MCDIQACRTFHKGFFLCVFCLSSVCLDVFGDAIELMLTHTYTHALYDVATGHGGHNLPGPAQHRSTQ